MGAACVEVSAVTRAWLRARAQSQPRTTMMAATRSRRSAAVPACPVEASWTACAARPGGSQRSQLSTPAKLAAVSSCLPTAFGTTWVNAS